MQVVPERTGCSRVCRLFYCGQAVGAGCSIVGRHWVQAVPECAGSWCRLFKSSLAVGAGCSRVCMQCVQAFPECKGDKCRLF